MAPLPRLSLARFKLESVSGELLKTNPKPGVVETTQAINFSCGDVVDKTNPGVLRLTMKIEGKEGDRAKPPAEKSKSRRMPAKTPEPSETAFTLEATIAATFVPVGDETLTNKELEEDFHYMLAQSYPYLRDFLYSTLDKMGARVNLPLSIDTPKGIERQNSDVGDDANIDKSSTEDSPE